MWQTQIHQGCHKADCRSAIHREIGIIESRQMQAIQGDDTEDARCDPAHRTKHPDTRELLGRRMLHGNRTREALRGHVAKHSQHHTHHQSRKGVLPGSDQQEDACQYIQDCQDFLGSEIAVGYRSDKR